MSSHQIINGDSLIELKLLPSDSIDAVITDPPYGYSFMGKDWDKAVPSVEIWKECLRVLKPGAFCCVMSAPRSDVQNAMISRLMQAGFRLDFTPIYWTYASGFPKAGNIGKMVDKRNGVDREVIGKAKAGKTAMGQNSGWNSHNNRTDLQVTRGESALEGSYGGFQPKPAVEVIIVAMKPLAEKTFVDQALKNGKGVSWLDDARIPTTDSLAEQSYQDVRANAYAGGQAVDRPRLAGRTYKQDPNGRFPANLLVSHDVLNDGVMRKTSTMVNVKRANTEGYSGAMPTETNYEKQGDSGSYSRYFDLDKWASTLPFLIVPKASKGEKNQGIAKNGHPTVKPLKLMSYLVTLFSREGDTVLDPFAGSGTTVLAAQKLGRVGIGIEKELEYTQIALARLAHGTRQGSLL